MRDRIRYCWVMPKFPEAQHTPALLPPGIAELERPRSFAELLWSLDQTTVGEGRPGMDTR